MYCVMSFMNDSQGQFNDLFYDISICIEKSIFLATFNKLLFLFLSRTGSDDDDGFGYLI